MGSPSYQLNTEYFFRLLYDCLRGACSASGSGAGGFAWFTALLTHLWLIFSILAYIAAILAFIAVIYCLIRLYELRAKEHHIYGEVHIAHEESP